MFAIEITSANLETILQNYNFTPKIVAGFPLFIKSPTTWYAVSGYVEERGAVRPWTVLPAHKLEKNYEYDPIKIQTDWDQIVRK